MNAHTLSVLEFDKIKAMLEASARTAGGRDMCRNLVPHASLAMAQLALNETGDAETELYRLGGSPIAEFTDISECVARTVRSGVLSPRELLWVATLLAITRQVQTALCPAHPERHDASRNAAGRNIATPLDATRNAAGRHHAEQAGTASHDAAHAQSADQPPLENSLRALARTLSPQRTLEDDIRGAILSEDELSDHASPALAGIRQKMRRVQEQVRERLDGFLRSSTMQSHLQEVLVTQRSGRFVLPVKSSSRNSVPGIVHDQSASGQTIFIEPMAVVQLNNQFRELQSQEREEIQRILAEFSARIALFDAALLHNQTVLCTLDFAFAKAELSRGMRGVAPVLNDQNQLNFVAARHPLINPDQVVPVDVHLGHDFRTLVITGPNTGGKTVSLKTVGLFSLMAAAGLHLPCAVGTRAAVFADIYADIGDEQSIEQSLSTFSSHISNIVSLLGEIRPGTLVLLDELGAGTDPTEGAALAISLLEHLYAHQVCTVATTHYSEVKAYALTTAGIENASMEFDVSSLRPTYRMSIGIPGQSNAFAIATRLGMPGSVIDRANALLTQEDIHFEAVISSAQEQRILAEREREVAKKIHQEAVAMREEAAALLGDLQKKEQSALADARAQSRRILLQAREQSDRAMQAAQKAKQNADNASIQALRDNQKALRDAILDAPDLAADETEQPLASVRVGQRVRLMGTTTIGEVLTLPDARGQVLLQAGTMRMKVSKDRLCDSGKTKANVGKSTRTVRPGEKAKAEKGAPAPAMSLDLRGKTLDESIPEIDAFLDHAMLSGLHEVTVIHGKGTGALRNGVQAHLKSSPAVQSYRNGEFGEGDYGVTVVKL